MVFIISTRSCECWENVNMKTFIFCKCVLRSEVALQGAWAEHEIGSEINFIFIQKIINFIINHFPLPEHSLIVSFAASFSCLRKTCTKWRFITWYARSYSIAFSRHKLWVHAAINFMSNRVEMNKTEQQTTTWKIFSFLQLL